jgi:hypothetical protein
MIILPRQVVHGFSVAAALLSVALICSCKPTTSSPREDLAQSLRGANLDGFEFATEEAGDEDVSSFTNRVVRNLIRLDGGDANLVLRYTRISTRSSKTARTYRTEITKKGAGLTLSVIDIGTNEVVTKETFPAPTSRHEGPFDSLEACLKDFDCVNRGPLQCEANRTCKDQYAALTCCLTSGECYSVHLVIKPTRFPCLLLQTVPDLEGVVFLQ